MPYDDVIDAIGHTPLVRLTLGRDTGVRVYAKLELQNLYGMKDRVAKRTILSAKATGELPDDAPIVESSSGTMALGVALVGTALGHEVHIVTDPRIDPITLVKLRTLGAHVHIVEAMTGHGWQSARLERLELLLRDLPGAFWPRQYSNPDNPLAYEALAAELSGDLDTIDVLAGTVGSGGSMCGTARTLRRSLPGLRVVGIDCVGSAIFGQPDRPQRLQSGLGNSLIPPNVDHAVFDEVHWLNDREAFDSTLELAAEQKIFAGNTSGAVYRVLRHLSEREPPGSVVVGILPDRGDRYHQSVYDDAYRKAHDLPAMPARRAPVEVEPGTVVGAWSYRVFKGGDRATSDLRRGQHDRDRHARDPYGAAVGP
ncbi:cysteine synthase family protein [Nonomuraea sp. NPDC050643]|uniref:cysteine synthase family protein n=1 Tax=Nonomuraea sp. NPDC050643 TaxID=3155660 RepID=UPI0033CC3823